MGWMIEKKGSCSFASPSLVRGNIAMERVKAGSVWDQTRCVCYSVRVELGGGEFGPEMGSILPVGFSVVRSIGRNWS